MQGQPLFYIFLLFLSLSCAIQAAHEGTDGKLGAKVQEILHQASRVTNASLQTGKDITAFAFGDDLGYDKDKETPGHKHGITQFADKAIDGVRKIADNALKASDTKLSSNGGYAGEMKKRGHPECNCNDPGHSTMRSFEKPRH